MSLMDVLGGGDLIKEIGATVRQVIPDPNAQRDFDLKIAELADKAAARETDLMSAQVEVNKIEAANPNIFVSGWRPFIGWMGGGTLAYTFMVAPLFHLERVDVGVVVELVLALLGVGGTLRTVEKVAGVATASAVPHPSPVTPIVQKTIGRWFKRNG